MKVLFVLFGMLLSVGISSADPPATAWSPAVTGLRGHLSIESTHDPDPTEPTYKVVLVLENVGMIGNLGKISQEIMIDFSGMDLSLDLRDEKSAERPTNPPSVIEEMIPSYTLCLPPDGMLSFPIGAGGDAPPKMATGQIDPRGKFLRVGPSEQSWVVPSTGRYFISGTLNCVRPIHASLEEHRRETPHAWHGTLVLPPVELPQN